jgi:hypothetical protein
MARRSKNRRKVNGFVFPVPLAGSIMLLTTLGLGYVWLGCRCDAIGKEIKLLESRKMTLEKKCLNEQCRWARMKSPANVSRKLASYNIKMGWPKRGQVVRLYDKSDYTDSVAKLERSVRNE